jgi:hypothetical protein
MSNTIEDLRNALFETLQGVRDGSVDLDQARAINDVAKTIVETAKVEVDYLRVTNGGESSFISSAIGADNVPPGLQQGDPPAQLGNGILGITRHRLRG